MTLAWVGFQKFEMLVLRAGERVVAGRPAFVLVVVFEHREIDDPQRRPLGAGEETFFVANLDAQRTEGVVDDFGLVRAKENQVA